MRHEEPARSAARIGHEGSVLAFIPSCVISHPAPASGLQPVPANTAKASISAATVLSRSLHCHPAALGPAKS
jgi:hypothetical protein